MVIPDCNSKVYRKGEHIATIYEGKPGEIEEIVKTASVNSGQKIDWHYFGGRGVVKVLGNIERATRSLKSELEERGVQGYRFTTENDSVIPWPLPLDKENKRGSFLDRIKKYIPFSKSF